MMFVLDIQCTTEDVLPGWIFLERHDLVRHVIGTLYPRPSIFEQHPLHNFIFPASLARIIRTTNGAITPRAGVTAFFNFLGFSIQDLYACMTAVYTDG